METRITRLAAVVAVSLASVAIAGPATAEETPAGEIDSWGQDEFGEAPSFAVWPDDDQVVSWGTWTPGATITLTVDDDADPGNGVLFSDSQPADPWGDWWFDLLGVFDLERGDFVTVDDGTTVKEHQVFDLFVDGVDPVADVVFGWAAPYSDVWVDAWVDDGMGTSLLVGADDTGAWTADLGGEGFDIVAGTIVYAYQVDEDGDQTGVGVFVAASATSALFYYNAATGFARFVDPGPFGAGTVIRDYYFRKGWTNITDVDLDGDGDSELFYYNAATGFARFVDPGPFGAGTVIQDYSFRKGWTNITDVDLPA